MTVSEPGATTLLVVDDDQQVVGFCRKCLTGEGFRILEADNGFDAILIAASHGGCIDLLITDIDMPHIRGTRLGRAFRALWPGTRILFMSGALCQSDQDDFNPEADLLPKPFGPASLIRTVKDVLAGSVVQV